MSRKKTVAVTAPGQLRAFVERIERLEEEKAALAADIREVKSEARSAGFDVKTINRIVKLRQLSEAEREEQEALLDVYKAALGMLGDTPLGAAALKRLQPKPPPAPPPADAGAGAGDAGAPTAPPLGDELDEPGGAPPEPPPENGPTVEEARALGSEAARAGKPVTDNPFGAGDPRRAAWDEGWCQADGSDGMEIPAAWRRAPKPKPDPKPGAGEGGAPPQ